MDLASIKRRLANGEGLTLEEGREAVSILEGEQFDLNSELRQGFIDSFRSLRALVVDGGDSAKVQASIQLIKMYNEQVIAEDGNVEISFEATDFKESANVEDQASAGKVGSEARGSHEEDGERDSVA